MNAKIRVPVIYEALVTPKGARKSRDVTFGEWMEFEVREVTDLEAPVALQWKESFHSMGVDGVCQRRWFNGELWAPIIYQASREPNEHVSLETAIKWAGRGSVYSPFSPRNAGWRLEEFAKKGKDEPLVPENHRFVHWSKREDEIAAMQKIAHDVICIDGLLWRKTFEPVYHLKKAGGFYGSFTVVDVTTPPNDEDSRKTIFRIDRFDDVVAYAKDNWNLEVEEDCRVHVLIPECVTYDDETPALRASLRAAVNSQKDKIGDQGRASILAWVDLREAVAEYEMNPNDETLTAAICAAETWIAVTSAYDFQKENLQRALDRWNLRPIRAEDDDLTLGYGR